MIGDELIPMQEVLSFKRSMEIGKLVSSLCKAQLSFDPIYKESENPAFKRGNRVSKYADMFSLVTATRKHLNNNGITIMQFPTVSPTGKNLIVTTLLAHESGEWVSHEILIPAVDERGFTAHSIGKAMTYARRYSWQAVTGAVAEDDDDGNEVSGQGTQEAANAVAKQKIAKAASEGNKTAQKDLESKEQASGKVSTLFYTMPLAHNGNFAEFINIRTFLANNHDREDELRLVFSAHKAKKTKDDTALVPAERLEKLLEVVVGDMGIDVKQLEAR